jgi:flagellar basal body L-ring protein FlgH
MNMPFSGDDMPWVAKVAYMVTSFIGGALASAYTVGVKMTQRDALNAKRDSRIEATEEELKEIREKLEKACTLQAEFCEKRWELIIRMQEASATAVSDRLCASFRQMMSDARAETVGDIGEIKISVATLVAQHRATEELRNMLKSVLDSRHLECKREN